MSPPLDVIVAPLRLTLPLPVLPAFASKTMVWPWVVTVDVPVIEPPALSQMAPVPEVESAPLSVSPDEPLVVNVIPPVPDTATVPATVAPPLSVTVSPAFEVSALIDSAVVSFNVTAPSVPLLESVPKLFGPVRLTVPDPLRLSVPAVTVPAPVSVAPIATTAVSVLDPTLSDPVRLNVPALTVVVP